jgi:prepilin-type N-terminal cleavage/methylation domain-containing protein
MRKPGREHVKLSQQKGVDDLFKRLSQKRCGLTLIEVLLAVTILSLGMVVMLTAISRCLRVMSVSTSYHNALWALSAGDAEFPMLQTEKRDDMEPEDFEVSVEDFGGISYERTIEDPYESDQDSDARMIVVRTRVAWSDRGKENAEEVVRYWLYREN